jgi:hypothetical protein
MTAELRPLYRVRFNYPEGWSVRLNGEGSTESRHFFFAEGECTGRVTGRFRGANHPLQRGDGTFQPDFQGIIETTDGAVIYFDYQGYGRSYPVEARQIVSSATHVSEHEGYRWLNDVVCVGIGEVRARPGTPTCLLLDVAELVWQPPGGEGDARSDRSTTSDATSG